jgi:hypothetical protein
MATTTENTVVARASIVSRSTGSFSADAVLIAAATITSPGIQSGWPGDIYAMPGNLLLGAIPYGGFTADAVIATTFIGVFGAEALIRIPTQVMSFTADAVISVASGNWLEAYPNTIDGTMNVFCSMADTNVVTIVIERENPQTGAWATIYSTSPRNAFFTDMTPPINTYFRYRGRGYDGSGMLIESVTSYPVIATMVNANPAAWAVTDGVSTVLLFVTSSSLAKELQTETFSPLGKPYKTVQVGNALGRKGSIGFFVQNSDRQITLSSLDNIVNSTRQTYLRTPFGVTLPVVFGPVKESLVSGGHSSVTMDYIENGAG